MMPELFRAIDRQDGAAFVSFLAPGRTFRSGNGAWVEGRDHVQHSLSGFVHFLGSLSHELVDSWHVPGGIVCHGYVRSFFQCLHDRRRGHC